MTISDVKLKSSRRVKARKASASLHTQLAESIGKHILKGTYPPGTILPNEAEWGRIYSASRTTVREAVKTLTAKGLVVSRTKVGSRVRPPEDWNMLDRDVLGWLLQTQRPQDYLKSIQQVRKMIEPEVAALAASCRSAAQLATIQRAFEDMKKAGAGTASIEPDVQFHLSILAAANNFLLTPFGVMIEAALRNMFQFTTKHNDRPDYFLPRHESILKAVEKKNPQLARKATLALLEDTDQTLHKSETMLKRSAKARG